jgi:hypothetical protein
MRQTIYKPGGRRRWTYVFCVTALAVFLVALPLAYSPSTGGEAVEAVVVHRSAAGVGLGDDDPQNVLRELVSLKAVRRTTGDSSEAASWRQSLSSRIAPGKSADELRLVVRCTWKDAGAARSMVDGLASDFIERRNGQTLEAAQAALSAARSDVRSAESARAAADARLAALDAINLNESSQRESAPPVEPLLVEELVEQITINPQWQRQRDELAGLEARRRQLLERYTEIHPAVRFVDQRIEECRRQLTAVPQQTIVSRPTFRATPAPVEPKRATGDDDARRRQLLADQATQLRRAAENARRRLANARDEERHAVAALERLGKRPAWSIAEAAVDSPAIGRRPNRTLAMSTVWATLFGGVMALASVIVYPGFNSVREARLELPAPIVGNIPSQRSSDNAPYADVRRWLWRLVRASEWTAGALLGGVALAAVVNGPFRALLFSQPIYALSAPGRWLVERMAG